MARGYIIPPTTAQIAEYGGRGYGRPGGGGPLLLFADSVFGRTTEGSYVSADVQTVQWFAANTRRVGVRGTLIEGSHSNYAKTSITLGAPWNALNGGSTLVAGSAAAGNAPDGTTPATCNLGANANGRITETIGTGVPDNTYLTQLFWVLATAAGQQVRPSLGRKDGTQSVDANTAITNAQWTRLIKQGSCLAGVASVIDYLNNSSAAAAQTFYGWAFCAFGSRYPLTPTRSLLATFVSGADVMTFLSAQVPLQLRASRSKWGMTPEWAPADLQAGDRRTIVSFGGANDVGEWFHDGVGVVARSVAGGVEKARSGYVVGAVREVRREVLFDPASGLVYVDGVAGAAGAAWTWAGGVQARVGGVLAAANEIDAYVEEPVAA